MYYKKKQHPTAITGFSYVGKEQRNQQRVLSQTQTVKKVLQFSGLSFSFSK
jgi:hypothetical protein